MAKTAHSTPAPIARRRGSQPAIGALDVRPDLPGNAIGTIHARADHFFDRVIRADCYAAKVNGTCCSPTFDTGDVALVSTIEPPTVGDFVVLHPVDGSTPLLKRLVIPPLLPIGTDPHPASTVVSVVLVETLSPGRLIGIRANSLTAMHRVVGAIPRDEAEKLRHPISAPKVTRARSRHRPEVSA